MNEPENNERRSLVTLALIMTAVSLAVGAVTITLLYRSAFREARSHLTETVNRQAHLIEAVARFDQQYSQLDHPAGAKGATLAQLLDAHSHHPGFWATGEFLVGRIENEQLVFLSQPRPKNVKRIKPLSLAPHGNLAEPMRRALNGESGTIIANDYRGRKVLAAYQPVEIQGIGIVAKVDVAEIRQPFIHAGLMAALVGALLVFGGVLAFFRVYDPIIRHIQSQNLQLKESTSTIETVNQSLQARTRELEKLNQSLRLKDEEVQLLLDSTSEAIYRLDNQGNCTMANKSCLRLLGYSDEQDLLGQNMHNLTHHTKEPGEPFPEQECLVYQALKLGEAVHVDDESLWRADGSSFAAEYRSYPIMRDAEIIGAVVTFLDITERKKAGKEVLAAEKKFRQFRENLIDGFVVVSLEGKILQFNEAYKKMLGYTDDEELLALTYQELTPKKWHEFEQTVVSKQILDKGFSGIYEKECIHKDGTITPIELRAFLAKDDNGEPESMWAIVSNISNRKEAEEKLRISLAEKEILLKEIHHRVKNNMQIISSLLYLQGEKTRSPEAVEAINESRARVKSMSLIHEKLYRSGDLARIDLEDYTKTLAHQITQSYAETARRIKLVVTADKILLPIDTAIPCGLIINELLSNSFKHAFPDDSSGEINIAIHKTPDDHLRLKISDNGVGLPEDFDEKKLETLGMRLVDSLAKQMGASCKFNGNHGMEYDIYI